MNGRTGVWLLGARGGVATTAIVGALGLRQGLVTPTGLATETPLCAHLSLPGWDELVFGGHDIRREPLPAAAQQIHDDTHTIPRALLEAVEPELREIDARIRPGILHGCGAAIERLADDPAVLRDGSGAEAVERIAADLAAFRDEEGLDRLVVVNLSSTEPVPPAHEDHGSAAGIDRLLAARPAPATLIASTLYAVAAARSGAAFVNFTPSAGALLPGVCELFTRAGLPFMGSDGKTGETLVKSALAPMFRYRNLRVLSWQGYNMLGDRDGEILQHEENRASKVSSKDRLLHDYLGYPLHTQVRIDYVPSLKDLKTAWDFIHFQGFLDFKMSLQFTWQGCDAILAAPLVLDLARLTAHAHARGESGPLTHLGVFFKSPHGVPEHDLHRQFHALMEYIEAAKS